MYRRTIESAREEVELSIQRLFYWAAYSDKYGGFVKETTLYGVTSSIHEPVGVVAIACPDEYPLLSFVSLFAPAVVRANTAVVVPSPNAPLCALMVCFSVSLVLSNFCSSIKYLIPQIYPEV